MYGINPSNFEQFLLLLFFSFFRNKRMFAGLLKHLTVFKKEESGKTDEVSQ